MSINRCQSAGAINTLINCRRFTARVRSRQRNNCQDNARVHRTVRLAGGTTENATLHRKLPGAIDDDTRWWPASMTVVRFFVDRQSARAIRGRRTHRSARGFINKQSQGAKNIDATVDASMIHRLNYRTNAVP